MLANVIFHYHIRIVHKPIHYFIILDGVSHVELIPLHLRSFSVFIGPLGHTNLFNCFTDFFQHCQQKKKSDKEVFNFFQIGPQYRKHEFSRFGPITNADILYYP